MTEHESQIHTNKVFQAKDHKKALELKEQVNGIIERFHHKTLGVCYIVRWFIPNDKFGK